MLAVLALLAGSKTFVLMLQFLAIGGMDEATSFLGWLLLTAVLSLGANNS